MQSTNIKQTVVEKTNGKKYLVASKCADCGQVVFPGKVVCPKCLSYEKHEKMLIGNIGKINNFTVAHIAPAGFSAPYIMGFVDLPEGPRVFSLIEGGIEVAETMNIGDEVYLSVEELADSEYKWKYVPVKK